MIRQLVTAGAALVAAPFVLGQVRKPTRWLGRLFLWSMNASHSALTDWGLGHVQIEPDSAILDVGCGGGRTIEKMAARASRGRVAGVDYSAESVAASRAQNRSAVEAGRVEIHQASVAQLPFPDGSFDLVTAVETHYYWPDLPANTREILRVLKPGGTLALIAEAYRGGPNDLGHRVVMAPLRAKLLSVEQHRELLAAAGFTNVQVDEERGHGWLCVTGTKPA